MVEAPDNVNAAPAMVSVVEVPVSVSEDVCADVILSACALHEPFNVMVLPEVGLTLNCATAVVVGTAVDDQLVVVVHDAAEGLLQV